MSLFDIHVGAYMSQPVHTVSVTDSLPAVSRRLRELELSSLAVVDGGELAGIITYSDLLRVGRQNPGGGMEASLVLPDQPVAEFMVRDVVSVQADASLRDAARLMVERRIHRVYVLASNELVGVLSTRDLMAAVGDTQLKTPALVYSSRPVLTAMAMESVDDVTDKLAKARVTGVVVVDESNWPLGVFSQREALIAGGRPGGMPVELVMERRLLTVPATMALHRVAAQAASNKVRRVVFLDKDGADAIMTGLDFARVVIEETPPER